MAARRYSSTILDLAIKVSGQLDATADLLPWKEIPVSIGNVGGGAPGPVWTLRRTEQTVQGRIIGLFYFYYTLNILNYMDRTENTASHSSSVIACVFAAAETCVSSCWLATLKCGYTGRLPFIFTKQKKCESIPVTGRGCR
jgi:hypothetical protein